MPSISLLFGVHALIVSIVNLVPLVLPVARKRKEMSRSYIWRRAYTGYSSLSCGQVSTAKPVSARAGLPAHQTIGMPAICPTMNEGKITKWFKKKGDKIAPGEIICEMETEKTVVYGKEYGFVAKIIHGDGAGIKFGEVIAVTVENECDIEDFEDYNTSAAQPTDPHPCPISQLLDTDDWEEPVDEFYQNGSLLKNQYSNPLIPGGHPVFGPHDLSDKGKLVLQSIFYLVHLNLNIGYCISCALSLENIKVSRKFSFIGLKDTASVTKLNANERSILGYRAGVHLFMEMLIRERGSAGYANLKLSEGLGDLFLCMTNRFTEEFIFYHSALLSAEGKSQMNQRMHRLLLREWAASPLKIFWSTADLIVRSQHYTTHPSQWLNTVKSYPFLDALYNEPIRRGWRRKAKIFKSIQEQILHEGEEFISHHRNVPTHCFDKGIVCQYIPAGNVQCIKMAYTFSDVMDCLSSAFPLYQKDNMELFATLHAFDHLEMNNYIAKFSYIPDFFGCTPLISRLV